MDERYYENAHSYIVWHLNHLNTKEDYSGHKGTIYDYVYDKYGREHLLRDVRTGSGTPYYDSADSYAASFLNLMKNYYSALTTGPKIRDPQYTDVFTDEKNTEKLKMIYDMLVECMDFPLHPAKALTNARFDYEVKYLMDNAEVYQGFMSAAHLFSKLPQLAHLEQESIRHADRIKNGIESLLWDENRQLYKHFYYDYSDGENSGGHDTDLQDFYPSALAQLVPISHDVLELDTAEDFERASLLYQRFCRNFPDWIENDCRIRDEKGEVTETVDYLWIHITRTAAVMQDHERVTKSLTNREKIYLLNGNKAPITCQESANICFAVSLFMSDYYNKSGKEHPNIQKYGKSYEYEAAFLQKK